MNTSSLSWLGAALFAAIALQFFAARPERAAVAEPVREADDVARRGRFSAPPIRPQPGVFAPESGREASRFARTTEISAGLPRTAPTVAETSGAGANASDSEARFDIQTVRRIGLNEADRLEDFRTSPNPAVRTAVMARYRALEAEQEAENQTLRGPRESGRFVPNALRQLLDETDSFAQGEALDYLGEYAGAGDPEAEATLRQFLQRPDLPGESLSHAAELLLDNYDLPPERIREAVQASPSLQNLPEQEAQLLLAGLQKLFRDAATDESAATVPAR